MEKEYYKMGKVCYHWFSRTKLIDEIKKVEVEKKKLIKVHLFVYHFDEFLKIFWSYFLQTNL